MRDLKRALVRLRAEEAGQDLVEYALIAGLIGFASVAAMSWFASSLASTLNAVGSELCNAV